MSVHAYAIKDRRMVTGQVMAFPEGERIIAVLETTRPPGLRNAVDLTVLVELPAEAGE